MFQDMDYARARFQRASGSTDYGAGVAGRTTGLSRGTETASGLNMLISQQQQIRTFKWLLAEETGVSEGLNIVLSDIQQSMTKPQMIKILGENKILSEAGWAEFVLVRPEDIAGRWNVYAIGGSKAIEKADQAAIFEKLTAMAGQMPEVFKRLKQEEVWVEAAEMAGWRSARKYIRNEEEQMQYEQQQFMKAVQQQQAIQAVAPLPQEEGVPSAS
jgi:hypothetical protein